MWYFMRHGESLGNTDDRYYKDDSHCFLTVKGTHQVAEAANQVKKAGYWFDHVVSSDLLRARQTANLMCQHLGIDKFPPRNHLWNEWDHDPLTKDLHRINIGHALMSLNAYSGNVLCVNHYGTIQHIIDHLGIDRSKVISGGKHVPPASILVVDPDTYQLVEFHHPYR